MLDDYKTDIVNWKRFALYFISTVHLDGGFLPKLISESLCNALGQFLGSQGQAK